MSASVSGQDFRNAMARLGAAVSVIATDGPAGRGGFTATAVCSVSDSPPTLLVCMNSKSAQCETFIQNGSFAVNILATSHRELAALFSGKSQDMAERFAAASWVQSGSRSPLLEDAVAAFDCTLDGIQLIGTHHVMLGKVVNVRSRENGRVLLYVDRAYVSANNLN